MSLHLNLSSVTAAIALTLASSAYAAVIPAGVALSDKQELIRNNGSEPESLDPALSESVPAHNISRDLFEALTATDNNGAVVPGLAETWKQTDATTWVFKLRANAKWSNGEAITADDVVYGIRRFLEPSMASPYASTFGIFLLNGLDVVEGKKPTTELGVKALDKHTLEIKTPFPVSYMPELVSNTEFAPIHKATVDKFGKAWTKPGNIVSNGAFTLSDWQVNAKIVLTKNPQYWDAKNVALTKSTYLAIESADADVKLYESGENHWVYQLPAGTYDKYKAQYPKEMRNALTLGLRYYSFNNQDPLLKDMRVRKALSMVVDRDILAKKVTADGQAPAYGVIVQGTKGADVTTYDWAAWPMDKRVAEAKKLLAEAGVKPGSQLKFAYNTSDYHKKMAIFVASEWKTKLGLDMDMEAMEFKVLLKKRHDGDYQVARNGWVADYNDATTFLTLVQCDSDQNDNKNCNKKADELITQGNKLTDDKKRAELLTQAAKLVMDDYPMLPLLQYTMPRLVKPWVGGYSNTNSMDRYRSKDLYIIKH